MNHPWREKKGVYVDVCASLSLFMGRSVAYEQVICFYMSTLLHTIKLCVCV